MSLLHHLRPGALLAAAALVLACGNSDTTTGGAGGAAPVDPLPLKIVTWNVLNLVDAVDDGLIAETTDSNYPAHRAAVGVVLAGLDADIVVLQEVEKLSILEDLDSSDLGGLYPFRALVEGNDPRGIDVGVLSKIPFVRTLTHKEEFFSVAGTSEPAFRFARDCLEVHVEHNGRSVVLLGVHYKAKDNDNPDKRLAEAQQTRTIADTIAATAPETAIVVLGDFNDTPGSLPYAAVAGTSPVFSNVADQLAPQDQWSFNYKGKLELVDHQMMNPLLAGMLDGSSVQIQRGAEVDAASDHAPVMATYLIR